MARRQLGYPPSHAADTATKDYVDGLVQGGRRVAWLWPFTVDSTWNLPIATSAMFERATDTRTANYIATSTGAGTIVPWISYTGYNMPFTKASYSDPLATMTDTGDAARSDTYRIPATAAIAGGTDGSMGIVTPDGRFLHETWITHRTNSTTYTTSKHVKSDLYGRGNGPGQGIHANGASIAAGVIREWEIWGGPEGYGEIRHALAMGLDGSQLYYAGGGYGIDGYQRGTIGSGYVWPATEQDFDSPTSYTGQVPMGALAAIPPWVNLTTLGLSPSGLVIARACQRYGLYVVDRTSLTWGLSAEESIATSRWTDWLNPAFSDVGTIRAQCRLVTNNTIYTPGGGVWTGDARNRVAPIAPLLPAAPLGRPT